MFFVVALSPELLSKVRSVVSSAVAFIPSDNFVSRPPSKREAPKIVYFERYSPVILQSLMLKRLIKSKLVRYCFYIGVICCPKTNGNTIVVVYPWHWGCIVATTAVRSFLSAQWLKCYNQERRMCRGYDYHPNHIYWNQKRARRRR